MAAKNVSTHDLKKLIMVSLLLVHNYSTVKPNTENKLLLIFFLGYLRVQHSLEPLLGAPTDLSTEKQIRRNRFIFTGVCVHI